MSATLQSLADQFGCELRGDASYEVERVAALDSAGPEAVSFLANPKFVPALPDTRAGAVILRPEHADACPSNCLIAANPYAKSGSGQQPQYGSVSNPGSGYIGSAGGGSTGYQPGKTDYQPGLSYR